MKESFSIRLWIFAPHMSCEFRYGARLGSFINDMYWAALGPPSGMALKERLTKKMSGTLTGRFSDI